APAAAARSTSTATGNTPERQRGRRLFRRRRELQYRQSSIANPVSTSVSRTPPVAKKCSSVRAVDQAFQEPLELVGRFVAVALDDVLFLAHRQRVQPFAQRL